MMSNYCPQMAVSQSNVQYILLTWAFWSMFDIRVSSIINRHVICFLSYILQTLFHHNPIETNPRREAEGLL